MIDVRFRPLPAWPYPPTKKRRSRWTFKAAWPDTLDLLDRELRHLHARNTIIAAGFRERDIRLDGWPRADARAPEHPGVEVSFDTPTLGRLAYATDVCEAWQHNVRSIALGLQALRAVDRYGITRRGEQYAGWKQLPAGGDATETHDEAWAWRLLCGAAGVPTDTAPISGGLSREQVIRRARAAAHPDTPGGSHEQFLLVQEATRILGGAS